MLRGCRGELQKIEKRIPGWEGHRITLHRAALWNESGLKLQFIGTGLSGRVNLDNSDGANANILTECIDDFAYRDLGFIKMDLEGGERQALSGGKNYQLLCSDPSN